jgi:DNA repair protein RadD
MGDLWPHQVKAINDVFASMKAGHRSPLLQLPVRAGKTRIASAISSLGRSKGRKIIFTVPLTSLIDQTVEQFESEGMPVGVIQAHHAKTNWLRQIQICSVQTLIKRQVPDFDLAIIDEAHIVYSRLIELLRNAKKPFIGLSATPWTRGLGNIYDDLVFGPSMRELMGINILTKYRVWGPSKPDLAGVETVGDDFNKAQLGRAVNKPHLIGDIVKTWIDKAEGRGTLVFAVNRAHAQEVHKCFMDSGVRTVYVDGDTDVKERQGVKEKYHDGEIKVIVSIGVFKMGVDWDFRAVIDAQPTKSEMSFVQRLGRGLTAAEGKEDCWFFDHAGNHERIGRFIEDVHHDHLSQGNERVPCTPVAMERLPRVCPACSAIMVAGKETCPSCGAAKPRKRCDVVTVDGMLIEMDENGVKKPLRKNELITRELKQRWFSQLLWIARERNYKYAWARYRYQAKFKTNPSDDRLIRVAAPPDMVVLSFVRSRDIAYAKSMGR